MSESAETFRAKVWNEDEQTYRFAEVDSNVRRLVSFHEELRDDLVGTGYIVQTGESEARLLFAPFGELAQIAESRVVLVCAVHLSGVTYMLRHAIEARTTRTGKWGRCWVTDPETEHDTPERWLRFLGQELKQARQGAVFRNLVCAIMSLPLMPEPVVWVLAERGARRAPPEPALGQRVPFDQLLREPEAPAEEAVVLDVGDGGAAPTRVPEPTWVEPLPGHNHALSWDAEQRVAGVRVGPTVYELRTPVELTRSEVAGHVCIGCAALPVLEVAGEDWPHALHAWAGAFHAAFQVARRKHFAGVGGSWEHFAAAVDLEAYDAQRTQVEREVGVVVDSGASHRVIEWLGQSEPERVEFGDADPAFSGLNVGEWFEASVERLVASWALIGLYSPRLLPAEDAEDDEAFEEFLAGGT
ncbi:MAG: hypothetical protein GY711_34810 [bacterium]|nr:hypothetical protein [bacterium]